jgi:Nucleotidyl transferase
MVSRVLRHRAIGHDGSKDHSSCYARRRGKGLWPASREVRPKQFLPLFAARSTFQDTLVRVLDANLFDRPIVITNAAYRFMVLEQPAEIDIEADVLYAGTPLRRLQPVRPSRNRATETRSCWPLPP